MTSMRTLPIRLGPVAGEAVDSWLEALAARTHTAFGDLLSAVGIDPCHATGTSAWIVQLSSEEAAAISGSSGVTHATLAAMTLAHYSGRAVGIDRQNRTVNRTFPWGPTRGSRYCPACLAETGGRWQLAWRLGWTFACTEHRCLLADVCPHCGAVQRQRPHVGDLVPKPGRCARPAPGATGRSPVRCDTDLTAAAVTVFDVDHPVLHAQRFVNTIIDSATATSGVYRTCRSRGSTCWQTSGLSPVVRWHTPHHTISPRSSPSICSLPTAKWLRRAAPIRGSTLRRRETRTGRTDACCVRRRRGDRRHARTGQGRHHIRRERPALASNLLARARARGHGDQHRLGKEHLAGAHRRPTRGARADAQTKRSTALPDRLRRCRRSRYSP